jgi:hypothetical protein
MEAWTNSSTGVDELLPEGAPSADPAADQITPPPVSTLVASPVATTPPPEAAIPTPQPLTMVSGEIQVPAQAVPLVTIIPAPEPAMPARVTGAVAVVAAPPARDDSAFSDQIINWMRQGDRLADPRPVENLDLSDLAEPTDPVAHELIDSSKHALPKRSRSVGRWISVGAIGVAMAFGLYWAAQEPRQGAGYAAAAPAAASVADVAPVLAAPAPTPTSTAVPVAVAQTMPAADVAPGRHGKHRRGAGRQHHRHGR